MSWKLKLGRFLCKNVLCLRTVRLIVLFLYNIDSIGEAPMELRKEIVNYMIEHG